MSVESLVTGVLVGATAVTGGVSADANHGVTTGDTSASVQVTNVIHANDGGGTSYTEIVKTINGDVVREVTERELQPGEPVVVETSVEAVSGSDSPVHDAAAKEAQDIVASTTSNEVGVTFREQASGILSFVISVFKATFSFLGF